MMGKASCKAMQKFFSEKNTFPSLQDLTVEKREGPKAHHSPKHLLSVPTAGARLWESPDLLRTRPAAANWACPALRSPGSPSACPLPLHVCTPFLLWTSSPPGGPQQLNGERLSRHPACKGPTVFLSVLPRTALPRPVAPPPGAAVGLGEWRDPRRVASDEGPVPG